MFRFRRHRNQSASMPGPAEWSGSDASEDLASPEHHSFFDDHDDGADFDDEGTGSSESAGPSEDTGSPYADSADNYSDYPASTGAEHDDEATSVLPAYGAADSTAADSASESPSGEYDSAGSEFWSDAPRGWDDEQWDRPLAQDYPPQAPGDDEAAPGDPDVDDSGDEQRGHLTAQNVRRSLILVALGSIAAAVITLVSTGNLDSVFGSSDPSEVSAAGEAPVKNGSAEGAAFAGAEPGECLTWKDPANPEIQEVDCAQPHYFEVASRVDLSDYPSSEFGPHAQVTDAQRYAKLRDSICAPAATRYLDGKLDPSGRFTVGLVHPGGEGWVDGERTILCGLQETGVEGTTFRPIVGTVAGQDQSRVHAPGTCLGIANGLPTDPVDCGEDHSVEITGQVDMNQQFPGGWPPTADQDKFMAGTCQKMSEDYLGGPDALHNTTLTVYWDTIKLPSWLAGSRKADCTIGFGKAEGSYATLVGSAKGQLSIDGKPPAPAPEPPSGRSAPTPLPNIPAPTG